MPIYSISGPVTPEILVPHNAAWKPPEWTISFAIKTTTDVNRSRIFSTSTNANATSAGVAFEGAGRGLYVDLMSTQLPVADLSNNGWWRLGVTCDAVDIRTYANGLPSGYQVSGGHGAMIWDTLPLAMAALGDVTARFACPRIFNRKLSDAEMATLNTGAEITNGLIARWQLSEGTGQTLADDIGGFNATTTGTIDWSTDVPPGTPSGPVSPTGHAGFSSQLIGTSSRLIQGY
jgi:hypothetical protein